MSHRATAINCATAIKCATEQLRMASPAEREMRDADEDWKRRPR